MKFVVKANQNFVHDVAVRVPVDGGFEDHTLAVEFRVIDAAELAKFKLQSIEEENTFFDQAVAGFKNLVDEEGKELPMNDKLRARVLGPAFIRKAICKHYLKAVLDAQTGN